jgi:hypothetical protein
MHIHYTGHEEIPEEDIHDIITSITVDPSVTFIPVYAFEYYASLTHIEIPVSVTSIDFGAFMNCRSLKNIHLPCTVAIIQDKAFQFCTSLTSINLSYGITSLQSETFEGCTSLSSILIPDTVTNVEYAAFRDCRSLQSIILPDSITQIGPSAFFSCHALTHVQLSNNLRQMQDCMFAHCHSLVQIFLPNSVEYIGHKVFLGCQSLRHVYIPRRTRFRKIRYDAFDGCNYLIYLYKSLHPQLATVSTDHHRGYLMLEEGEKRLFIRWLRFRYDNYPFLKTCWNAHVSMEEIQRCIDRNGIECVLQVEQYSRTNGFDLLLMNPYIAGNAVFDMIATIILSLVLHSQDV